MNFCTKCGSRLETDLKLCTQCGALVSPPTSPEAAGMGSIQTGVPEPVPQMLIADRLSNIKIAEHLAISEKTVRNHASNVFDKLGVWSRAQAIVFARDRGFSA
jgi:hypothetical protein